ncbi:MAG: ATP-binding protein [Pyrinomonadaceae bacterium MAG19_C2-C3]|nr:ATP-binding protein [Pyrinomonadaceae bacterium MAG19_C2-C3]
MESRSIALEQETDIAVARNEVRAAAAGMGFSIVDQTRLTTVASELARNIIKYAVRGRVIIGTVQNDSRKGLRLIFEDNGPGIANTELAMRDGFTTGGGLGKGLPGSRRLVDDFKIESTPDIGTRVTVVRWLIR